MGAVWRPSAPLPHRYKRYGCRREAMAEASGLGKKHDQTNPLLTITPPLTLTLTLTLTPPLTPPLPPPLTQAGVRLFSASEVLLRVGLKAAAVPAARRHSLRPRPSAWSLRVVAQAAALTLDGLLAFDVVALLPPLRRALASLIDPLIEAAKGVAVLTEDEQRDRSRSGSGSNTPHHAVHRVVRRRVGAVKRGVGRWESALHRQVGGLRAIATQACNRSHGSLQP